LRRKVALAGFAAATAFFLMGPGTIHASAEITSAGLTCTGSIAGVDVAQRDSENVDQAIDVGQDSTVRVSMTSQQTSSNYAVDLAFSFRGWQVAHGATTSNAFQDTIKVNDYSRYGTGLYRVTATMDGPTGSCTAAALVRVNKSPIPDTIAGDIAAGLTILGLGGLALSSGKAAAGGGGSDSGGGGDAGAGGGGGTSPQEEVPTPLLPPDDDWCYPTFVMAALMTVGMMVTGGGAPPVAAVQRLPRAHWRPRVAGMAIVSSLVGAIGALLLLQQYGKVFPTAGVVIRAGVAAVVIAIAVPSLLRLISVRRYNRRVARYERLMANRAARQAAATTPPAAPPPAEPPRSEPPPA
jgi:hypothetical protein